MVEVRLSTKEGGKGGDHRYVYCQFEVSPGRNKQRRGDLMMMPGWAGGGGLLKRPNLLEVESGVPSRD